jgi:hypothetical protein
MPNNMPVATAKTMSQQETIDRASDADREHRASADDSNVPVGNAPPSPTWPLVLSGLAWLAWVVFLLVMVLSTRANSAV